MEKTEIKSRAYAYYLDVRQYIKLGEGCYSLIDLLADNMVNAKLDDIIEVVAELKAEGKVIADA